MHTISYGFSPLEIVKRHQKFTVPMLFINKYYFLRGGSIKGMGFSVNLDYMPQNATLYSSLKRAMIFKICSEVLSSVWIRTIARSSFLTWFRSQIINPFHSFSLVLQNTYLLGLCPLIFFILSAESHITSIHLPWTLGDVGENALFIYLQFCISLIYLVCGSRFSFGWHSIPMNSDISRSTWWSVIYCLLVCISVLLPCKVEVQKSIFLPFQICEIFLEFIFK